MPSYSSFPFLCRSSLHHGRPNPISCYNHQQRATFVEGAKMKWVRERGLDHAVEKEKHLRPLLSLKNLIVSEPSKSLPLSTISDMKSRLSLPFRAIKFIRYYPSVFLESPTSSSSDHRPRIGLTPDVLRLHDDEQSLYHSCAGDAADRLLRLLMITPDKKLPLPLIERLRFDLGLPEDYARSLLPDFPDYFQVSPLHPGGDQTLALELVCWSKELAESAMEKSAMAKGGYNKGMPLAFPLQFSKGFDMEKKVKKWVEEWQKLPYISPYEDGMHLAPKSDLGEKWVVGVLHEILHLLVPKKTERDNLLFLGEYMGLRSRFKRVFADHPGIFYVSNKIRTHTVVLREAYKRDLLVKKHPLMGIRYQYIHLMNKGKEMRVDGPSLDGNLDQKAPLKVGEEDNDSDEEDESGEEDDEEEAYGSFDSEDEDETDSNDEDEEGHFESGRGMRQIERQPVGMNRANRSTVQGRTIGRHPDKMNKASTTFSRRTELRTERSMGARSPGRQSYPQSGSRRLPDRRRVSGY
eukprot:TRINITY_DN3795_c0_g2_i4.p1 TRINITY_DN3795_c0_g2~~TRINITY_DN3795_c0_g2_i4.p1  ORF type:complete len:521 (-),score=117.24 TRINITY_DN3795_c0_g2_i4:794-2356(-)